MSRFDASPFSLNLDCVTITHAALVSRLQGHFNYFGVNGNLRCLKVLLYQSKRAWYKCLRRRSQRVRLTWGDLRGCCACTLCLGPASWSRSGAEERETYRRKNRMVETSLSGSGEGLGWATGRGYSTTTFLLVVCQNSGEDDSNR